MLGRRPATFSTLATNTLGSVHWHTTQLATLYLGQSTGDSTSTLGPAALLGLLATAMDSCGVQMIRLFLVLVPGPSQESSIRMAVVSGAHVHTAIRQAETVVNRMETAHSTALLADAATQILQLSKMGGRCV